METKPPLITPHIVTSAALNIDETAKLSLYDAWRIAVNAAKELPNEPIFEVQAFYYFSHWDDKEYGRVTIGQLHQLNMEALRKGYKDTPPLYPIHDFSPAHKGMLDELTDMLRQTEEPDLADMYDKMMVPPPVLTKPAPRAPAKIIPFGQKFGPPTPEPGKK